MTFDELFLKVFMQQINKKSELVANFLGEAFRDYCFVGDGYGCYSNFDLRPEFVQVEDKRAEEWLGYTENEFWGDGHTYHKPQIYSNGRIFVGWLWDGDGCLYFRVDDLELINYDCKKANGWEFVGSDL